MPNNFASFNFKHAIIALACFSLATPASGETDEGSLIGIEIVQGGLTAVIDKHNVCRSIAFQGPGSLMIPTFTAYEWSVGEDAFLNNVSFMEGVSVSECPNGQSELAVLSCNSPATACAWVDYHNIIYTIFNADGVERLCYAPYVAKPYVRHGGTLTESEKASLRSILNAKTDSATKVLFNAPADQWRPHVEALVNMATRCDLWGSVSENTDWDESINDWKRSKGWFESLPNVFRDPAFDKYLLTPRTGKTISPGDTGMPSGKMEYYTLVTPEPVTAANFNAYFCKSSNMTYRCPTSVSGKSSTSGLDKPFSTSSPACHVRLPNGQFLHPLFLRQHPGNMLAHVRPQTPWETIVDRNTMETLIDDERQARFKSAYFSGVAAGSYVNTVLTWAAGGGDGNIYFPPDATECRAYFTVQGILLDMVVRFRR